MDDPRGIEDKSGQYIKWVGADGVPIPLFEIASFSGGTMSGFGQAPPSVDEELSYSLEQAAESIDEALELLDEGADRDALLAIREAIDSWEPDGGWSFGAPDASDDEDDECF